MIDPAILTHLDTLTGELRQIQQDVRTEIRAALAEVDEVAKAELWRQISLQ